MSGANPFIHPPSRPYINIAPIMAPPPPPPSPHPYPLNQTFTHQTPTHEYRIRWTRTGNAAAPPLVFVHGTPWSSAVWHNLTSSLSTRYHIHLYDHPGFGLSPTPRRLVDDDGGDDDDANDKVDLDASLVLRADASAALFKHWDLVGSSSNSSSSNSSSSNNTSLPHVVCHDNGGLVSLRLLLEHGVRFASLCLVDVVAMGPFGLPFFKLVAENEGVFRAIPARFAEGFARAYVKSAACKALPEGIEDMLCAPWLEGGGQGSGRFLREMVQAHYRDTGSLEDEYGRVGGLVPTKIIWGRDDDWLPVEIAHRLKQALNAEELVVLEEAGHLVQYDQPGRLALEVGLWLGKSSKNDK